MARCSRCGWEYDIDIYVCDNCGYILQRESIERIPMFRRPEAKVYKPNKPLIRLAKIIYPMTTPFAFRDINNKKDKKGMRRVRLFSALFFAWWIWAILIHIKIENLGGIPVTGMVLGLGQGQTFNLGSKILIRIMRFMICLIFFIFGLFYYHIMILLYNFVFRIAANFAVQLDDILAVRFNVKRKKKRFQTILSGAAMLRRKKIGGEEEYTFETAAQGEKVLTKIKQTGISKIMGYAYAPFIVINFLSFLILLIFTPTITINNTDNFVTDDLLKIWNAGGLWFILDVLQIIATVWTAILVSIAQREIGNTNTTRLLIGNLIVAGIISFTTIMLRPTMGAGSWNIIESLSG